MINPEHQTLRAGGNLVGCAAALLLLSAQVSATNGYIPHGIGTASKAMAGAGTALPLDALSGLRNPAAMVHVGTRLDGELSAFMPNREYKANGDFERPPAPGVPPRAPSVPEGRESSENDFFLIPSFGVNWQIDERSSIGFSIVPQGGLNTEYDTSTFQNFAAPPGTPPNPPISPGNPTGEFTAGEPTGVDLMILVSGVTYAREVFRGHSLGLTPIFAAQRFKARGLQPFKQFSIHPNDLTNRGYDYSFGGGFGVGYLGQLHEKLHVGASYQSRLWMSDFDKYKGLFAKGGSFDIPPIVNAGLALNITPDLTVLADYQRIFYGDIKALDNDNNPSLPLTPDRFLGASDGLGFGWEDVDIWKVGVQWNANSKVTVRAGYSNGEEPWSGPNTLFNILAPATIEDHLSFGLNFQINKRNALALGYTHAFQNTIQGQSAFTGPQTGHVRMHQHIVDVGWTYDF